jgi:hypothetical protein
MFLLLGTGFLTSTNANPVRTSINDGTQYWALLIAVGVYADNPDRNFPSMLEGVDDLYNILLTSSCWSPDHIKIIKGKDATVVNIIQGFRWLDRMDDSDDISLIYITTHGGQLPYDIPPRDEGDGYDEILASYWDFAYPSTFISDDEINFLLNRLDSKGVCLIVDSCYAGGFNDTPTWTNDYRGIPSSKELDLTPPSAWMEGFAEDVRGNGRVVLMSSRENEESYEDSYFTPFLSDGLRGYADNNTDGNVSAEELFSYVKTRIFYQHPTIYDDFPGELPLMTLHKGNISKANVNHWITKKGKCRWPITEVASFVDAPIVRGYITHNVTGNPIDHAFVDLSGRATQGNYYERQTYTNSYGYYSLSVLAGSFNILVIADEYFWNQTNTYEIDENEIVWINISLVPYPPENSIVCGYISDEKTNDPLASAEVHIYWNDGEGHELTNKTSTNLSGFYTAYVPAGSFFLYVEAAGYFANFTKNYEIDEYHTLWINVSLEPRPPEHSVVCGYITDAQNNESIDQSYIELEWHDNQGHVWYNSTRSKQNGFYTLHSAAGEIYLYTDKRGYCDERSDRKDVKENETLWVNISLTKDTIQVDITKPLRALYIMNQRIIPFSNTIIIGRIDIEVYVHNYLYFPLDAKKVEFYIDGTLKSTDTTSPYSWTWKSLGLIKHRHTIKVMAYDTNGNSASDEIIV